MGFVRVGMAAGDRRRRVLVLLPAGLAALVAAVPVWEREHTALEGLSAYESAAGGFGSIGVIRRRVTRPGTGASSMVTA